MSKFPSKRVAITGAGSGLGRALALHYARAGFRVAVLDIQFPNATETLRQVESLGGSGFACELDVRRDADFTALVERLEREWGGVDIVVNNAGVAAVGEVLSTPMDEWQWMLDINLLGVVRGTKYLGALLARQRAGHIVNTASFAGLAGAPGMASYGVAKAAVVALSEQTRAEMVRHGVGVTVVCPSFFTTNLLDSMRGGSDRVKEKVAGWMRTSALSAEDIAALIDRAVERNQFLLIPHRQARQQHWLKRFLPGLYFKKMIELSQKMAISPVPAASAKKGTANE